MKKLLICLLLGLGSVFAFADEGGDLDAKEVFVELGMNGSGMYFKPNHLEFKRGVLYKLVLHNSASVLHEFASEFLTQSVDTLKVEILDQKGNMVAEIVGGHPQGEVEIGAGGTVEWYFMPTNPGKNEKIVCELPGHEESGMVGTVTIL